LELERQQLVHDNSSNISSRSNNNNNTKKQYGNNNNNNNATGNNNNGAGRSWLRRLWCWGCNALEHENKNAKQKLSWPKVQVHLVNIFVNVPQNDTLITFSRKTGKKHSWHRVQRELQKSYSKLRQYDAQYLTYALLDQVVDLIRPITNTMRREIALEVEYLHKVRFHDSLEKVHAIRHEIEFVCRKIKPLKNVLSHAIQDEEISPGATVYLRDVLDNLEQEDEELKQLVVECQMLGAEADKVKSKQMDRTLYTLTVVSTIFLPAQFLTGVWGMNFDHMPELDNRWFYPGFFWAFTAFIMVTLLVALNFGRVAESAYYHRNKSR